MKFYRNARDPNIRNYGWGSRDPRVAIKNAICQNYESLGSVATIIDRLNVFLKFYEHEFGMLKDLRHVEPEHCFDYSQYLVGRVQQSNMAISYAHNCLSAVNMLFQCLIGNNEHFHSAKVCGLPPRNYVANVNKASDCIPDSDGGLLEAFISLCRWFGLRFEEAAKLELHKAWNQVQKTNQVLLERGTKGGRPRAVPVLYEEQTLALIEALEIIGSRRCLIHEDQSYVGFRVWMYQVNTYSNFHSYRHAYAQMRYLDLSGFDCPVVMGVPKVKQQQYVATKLDVPVKEVKALDKGWRLEVAEELGHSRDDICGAYLG